MCACACVCRIVVLPCHKCLARPSSASTRTSCWGNLCAQIESTVAKDSAKGCKGQGTLYLYYFNLFHIKGCCEVQSPFQFDFQFKGCANCIGLGVCFLPSSCPMNGMGWNTPVRRTVTLSNSHSFEIQDRSWMNHIQTGLLSKSPSLLGFGPPVQTVFAHPFIDWAWLGHLCHLMNTANMSIGRRYKCMIYSGPTIVSPSGSALAFCPQGCCEKLLHSKGMRCKWDCWVVAAALPGTANAKTDLPTSQIHWNMAGQRKCDHFDFGRGK